MVLHLDVKDLPSVSITLDIERHMRIDINAMALFQRTTGKDLISTLPKPKRGENGELLPADQQNDVPIDWSDLLTTFWVSLQWEDTSLTVEEAGILMSLAPIDEIVKKLMESIDVGMSGLFGRSPAAA